jgi:hypothetical protein
VSVRKVVSGGQTGADRAALDAALTLGLPYGGWCPAGGEAEDGPGLLDRYPALQETPSSDPSVRTAWNVRDSDATLVLSFGPVDGSSGTSSTVSEAEQLGRPLLVAHPSEVDQVRRWLAGLPDGCTVDVAGPRESEEPGLYDAAYLLLTTLLSEAGSAGTPAPG